MCIQSDWFRSNCLAKHSSWNHMDEKKVGWVDINLRGWFRFKLSSSKNQIWKIINHWKNFFVLDDAARAYESVLKSDALKKSRELASQYSDEARKSVKIVLSAITLCSIIMIGVPVHRLLVHVANVYANMTQGQGSKFLKE